MKGFKRFLGMVYICKIDKKGILLRKWGMSQKEEKNNYVNKQVKKWEERSTLYELGEHSYRNMLLKEKLSTNILVWHLFIDKNYALTRND